MSQLFLNVFLLKFPLLTGCGWIVSVFAMVCVFQGVFIFFQAKKQRELQSRIDTLQAHINPHFVSNSLNAIDSLILQNKREAASKYLGHFSRHMRSALKISSGSKTSLAQELETLKHFLAMEKLRFQDKLQYEIVVDPSVNPRMIEVPNLLLLPLVEKAIWYGIKPKKEPGFLSVYITQSENGLECIIEDDGIGRKKAKELKADAVLKEKSMDVQNEGSYSSGKIKGLEIEDLKDHKGNSLGTRVILPISLKVNKEKMS